MVASLYTDAQGYTPLHISRTKYQVFAGVAWGFRKGAPFLKRFSFLKQMMIEAGLIDHWMEEATAATITNYKKDINETVDFDSSGVGTEKVMVVLTLHHLQGVFYLLLLGYGLAFLALLQENLIYTYTRSKE
ncbi:uncharacterized protein LOC121867026 [Homarus americanus]|uniref:Putative glutamate receptor ionotropic, kainate 2-like 21 n=1 Tax=Homarus americanus TaxID=6706 RepID=A0A8J5MZ27_HOMAM|nr:uncharacterized protein LOC121867026 [Homarus americanus]KAG7168604.1 putative glutamate receptor ionotropic, kainate 2-like 21 [Homarus americanus]